MPLITKDLPLREDGDDFHDSVQVQHPNSGKEEKEDKDSGYEDFEEFDGEEPFEDSDMEGSILHRGRPKKPVKAPALPQRSDKRASKILENVMLELKSLDGSKTKEVEQQSILEDPHELYLSSEEDASLSDDYEDSLIEFDTTGMNETERATSSSSTASSRQEVTARVVSFILVGKPQIIDIYIPSPQKRHSMALDLEALSQTQSTQSKPTPRRPSPLKLYPSSIRRMSISSIASISTHNSSPATVASREGLPQRKSSKFASNLTNLVTSTKSSLQQFTQQNHSFLNSDPFAAQEANEDTLRDDEPVTPKTPTSMAAAAWKRGFNRTLSKARKPSMPKLNLSYTPGVVTARNSSKVNLAATNASEADLEAEIKGEEEMDERKQIQRSVTMPTTPHEGPILYEDIMKNVIRAPPPPPLGSPRERRSGGLGMMGLGRKKSLKGK